MLIKFFLWVKVFYGICWGTAWRGKLLTYIQRICNFIVIPPTSNWMNVESFKLGITNEHYDIVLHVMSNVYDSGTLKNWCFVLGYPGSSKFIFLSTKFVPATYPPLPTYPMLIYHTLSWALLLIQLHHPFHEFQQQVCFMTTLIAFLWHFNVEVLIHSCPPLCPTSIVHCVSHECPLFLSMQTFIGISWSWQCPLHAPCLQICNLIIPQSLPN